MPNRNSDEKGWKIAVGTKLSREILTILNDNKLIVPNSSTYIRNLIIKDLKERKLWL